MIILSIQYHSHDSSVALVKDGKILFAASNERLSRVKMDKSFPELALRNCLKFSKIPPLKIDKVVIVGEPLFPQSFFEILNLFTTDLRFTRGEILRWAGNPFSFIKILLTPFAFILAFFYKDFYPFLKLKMILKGFKGEYIFINHHMAHLYSAYYLSGWKECLVGCIEGGGRIKAMSFYKVVNNKWEKITECNIPDSAGMFYALCTYLLGFKPLRHEGKITGLAAYGNPKKAYQLVSKLLWVEGLKFRMDFKSYIKLYSYFMYNKKLPKDYRDFKKADIAAAFQKRLEDCVLKILKQVLATYKVNKIALAGGVMANVKLNQKIFELPEIKEIFIHPAMGDDGLALGAALHVGYENGMRFKRLKNVYFGPEFSDLDIKRALKKYQVKYQFRNNIETEIAKLLAAGYLVGRFNGRMEYGPRALGNRSILCQATDPKINQTLNDKLKRTEFMPFAPVILKEYASKCLRSLKGAEYTAKFMTITFDCTNYLKRKCPAVVHVDGTARPQIIDKAGNPNYYKILKEYYKITKIPVLINTSFNMHEEPIVCTPEDAIRSFLKGNIDYLAIGNYLLRQN